MHHADTQILQQIERGERTFDWSAWFGSAQGADYLTTAGRDLSERAARDLENFFGRRWMAQAMAIPASGGRPAVPALGRTSPLLASSPDCRPSSYIEGIGWWASLRALAVTDTPGWRTVRTNTLRDVKADKFAHTLTQARLAGLGLQHGASVTLEPEKAGGPGDVLLEFPQARLLIEVMTLGGDVNMQQSSDFSARCFQYLLSLEQETTLHWSGDLPDFLCLADYRAWQQSAQDAAERCAASEEPVTIRFRGWELTVTSGLKAPNNGLSTAVRIGDPGQRLLAKLRKKAVSSQGAGKAWIWVEDLEDQYPAQSLARLPLRDKVFAFARLLEGLLGEYPHIAGIVWSKCVEVRLPTAPDEQVHLDAGVAMQRSLPLDRLRHTVLMPGRLLLPDQTRLMARLCGEEPRWLDWALDRLDVPGGVGSLLANGVEWKSPLLWTP